MKEGESRYRTMTSFTVNGGEPDAVVSFELRRHYTLEGKNCLIDLI